MTINPEGVLVGDGYAWRHWQGRWPSSRLHPAQTMKGQVFVTIPQTAKGGDEKSSAEWKRGEKEERKRKQQACRNWKI